MKKIIFLSLLLVINLSYAEKLKVVASFSILGDIVKNIGKDKIDVITIVGNNQDVHSYEIKPSDLQKFNASKILFINGLGLEAGWINKIIKSYKGGVVTASDGIKPLYGKNQKYKIDSHAWNDPVLVETVYIQNILNGLIKIDPSNKEYYIKNAANYSTQINKLNKWADNQFKQILEKDRYAVTTHDAFNYFAKRYKISFITAQGVSTDSDASAKDIVDLETMIRKNSIKVVFLENMTNNNLIKQIAKDTSATIGGKLYSDALSEVNEPANNYLNMIKYNINTIISTYLKKTYLQK